MCNTVTVSSLSKTWIFDLDGTLVKHNGYKLDGKDSLLPGVAEFFRTLSAGDMVVLLTSRPKELADITETFLKEQNIRYNAIVYDAPYGERILINDKKPSGLQTALAVNTDRNIFLDVNFKTDTTL